jgi:electron transfer flavoprotein alpha/beta subunit
MNIIVCIKQIPDPEAVVEQFSADEAAKKLIPAPGVAFVINPFDENAIEAALQLKEAHGGKVTALSLGPDSSLEALKRALQMGADEAALIEDPGLPEPDPQGTAYLLAKGIEKIGEYDLVICGRQAGDWDQGQVGIYIADFLNIPSVTIVTKIEKDDGFLRVERLAEDGYEIMQVGIPALLTVSNEINLPRLTPVAAILRAASITIPVWSTQDIGVEPDTLESSHSHIQLDRLYIPEIKGECELIQGEDGDELAANLIKALEGNKIISDLLA